MLDERCQQLLEENSNLQQLLTEMQEQSNHNDNN